jgi:hypothetical protein
MNSKPKRIDEMRKDLVRKEIDESRAAALLGFDRAQFGRLCEQSGLGRKSGGDASEGRWFTYQELHQLCRWVTGLAA